MRRGAPTDAPPSESRGVAVVARGEPRKGTVQRAAEFPVPIKNLDYPSFARVGPPARALVPVPKTWIIQVLGDEAARAGSFAGSSAGSCRQNLDNPSFRRRSCRRCCHRRQLCGKLRAKTWIIQVLKNLKNLDIPSFRVILTGLPGQVKLGLSKFYCSLCHLAAGCNEGGG